MNRSPLSSVPFKALIESSAKIGSGKEIEIEKCSEETFKEALQFIYTGEIQLSQSYIELFKFAYRFRLKELCDHCEDQIMKNLTQNGVEESSFTDLIFLATACEVEDLLLPCLKFANTCADKVDLTVCPRNSFPKMLTLAVEHSFDPILKRLEDEIIARMKS